MADTNFPVPTVSSCVSKHDYEKYHQSNVESSSLPTFNLTPSDQSGKYYYGVRVVTGEQDSLDEEAGTKDTGVFVSLIGSKAQSGKIYLLNWLTALSGRAKTRTYDDLMVETDQDLGDILVVVLGNDKNWIAAFGAPWFVDFVDVHDFQSKSHQEFPCYHWIGDGCAVTFTAKTALRKDVSTNSILVQQREDQLKVRKAGYKWQPIEGMPSAVEDLEDGTVPDDEKFSRVKHIHFTEGGKKAGMRLKLEGFFITVDNIFDYEELSDTLGVPDKPLYEAARWTSDVEVGRQMLNGVNPMMVERCTKLPSNFSVTNEMVKNILCRGMSLEEEMKAGRVYIVNFEMMDGLTAREGCHFTAPIGLFYVNLSGQLVPIAIQLRQGTRQEEKDIPNPIFLSTDGWIDWLLAKMHFQSANMQFHQIVTHYLSCHAVLEAYGVATQRNLPDPHPIFKLLVPHFRYTMAINSRGRKTLMNDGGIVDQRFGIGGKGKGELFARGFSAYSVHWTNIKRSVERRGVHNATLLPGYYYRDDGLKLWGAIEQYARDVVNEFYASDDDVKQDQEIQSWAADIHTNAFPAFRDGKQGHDFPKEIASKDQLIEHATTIIFTASVQHTSVNFGQFYIFGYVPNAPCALLRPPPERKGVSTYKTILETLPDKATAIAQIAITFALSQYSDNEVYFGDFPSERFTESNVKEAIKRFRKRLSEISVEIRERNDKLDVAYDFMIPEKISNSITT